MDARLKSLIAEILQVPPGQVDEHTGVDTAAEWDSLRHMNIVFALEDAYGVRFDDDEIAGLTSVERIVATLAAKGI